LLTNYYYFQEALINLTLLDHLCKVSWDTVAAGAQLDMTDEAVAVGGGTWHPGGVAVADLIINDRSHM
jgi:hypothetical protein